MCAVWQNIQGAVLYTALRSTALYCTVLQCIALYCTVLHCTALYCTVLYCIALYCNKTSNLSSSQSKPSTLSRLPTTSSTAQELYWCGSLIVCHAHPPPHRSCTGVMASVFATMAVLAHAPFHSEAQVNWPRQGSLWFVLLCAICVFRFTEGHRTVYSGMPLQYGNIVVATYFYFTKSTCTTFECH